MPIYVLGCPMAEKCTNIPSSETPRFTKVSTSGETAQRRRNLFSGSPPTSRSSANRLPENCSVDRALVRYRVLRSGPPNAHVVGRATGGWGIWPASATKSILMLLATTIGFILTFSTRFNAAMGSTFTRRLGLPRTAIGDDQYTAAQGHPLRASNRRAVRKESHCICRAA